MHFSGFTYKVSDFSSKKDTMHSRVIWSCAWMPDSHHFVTASRDKTVALWGQSDTNWVRQAVLNESNEVTAVAVTRNINKKTNSFLVATGKIKHFTDVEEKLAKPQKYIEEFSGSSFYLSLYL